MKILKVEILDKDLRIDTYRSSGAGGQHVNTTDSAVRITHLPTNIVVQCQNERSQHKNKETCMTMLKARLYEHELEKKENKKKILKNQNQILVGVIKLDHMFYIHIDLVKDNRTNEESSDPDKILNGDIDNF